MIEKDKDFEKIDKAIDKLTNKMDKELVKAYADSLSQIRYILSDVYRRYGDKDGKLSYSELNRFNQLANIENQLVNEIDKLTGLHITTINKGLFDLYGKEYEGSKGIIDGLMNNPNFLPVVDPNVINESIQAPVDGIKLNDRIQNNRDALVMNVKQTLTRGLVMAKGYQEMTNDLKNVMGMDHNKASRIIRTEAHRIQNQARLNVYQEAENKGLEMYKMWVSTLDGRTRRDHASLDGKTIPVSDNFKVGRYEAPAPSQFHVAKEDINCRCRIVARFPDDIIDKRNIGGNVQDYQTYNQWQNGEKGSVTPIEHIPKNPIKKPKQKKEKVVAPVNVFTPAKTIAEASDWAKNNLFISKVDYNEFDVRLANDVNQVAFELQKRFPNVMKNTKRMGTIQKKNDEFYEAELEYYANKLMKEKGYSYEVARVRATRIVTKRKASGEIAHATNIKDTVREHFGQFQGIYFNKKYTNKKGYDEMVKSEARDKETGFAVGGTPASVFVHEFGHQIDYFLRTKSGASDEFDQLWNKFVSESRSSGSSKQFARDELSEYGASQKAEFFAECFTEYYLRDNPRRYAKEFGSFLEKQMKHLQ